MPFAQHSWALGHEKINEEISARRGRRQEVNKPAQKGRDTTMPAKRQDIHMHNSNRSSHVKTGVFFPNIYCSNEVLHFDPRGQEKTVELIVIHNSPQECCSQNQTSTQPLSLALPSKNNFKMWLFHAQRALFVSLFPHGSPFSRISLKYLNLC